MKDLLAIDDLTSFVSKGVHETYIEARYQSRLTNEVNFSNGELERIRTGLNAGCVLEYLSMDVGDLAVQTTFPRVL